jgi:hypothetical protein
MSRTAFNRAEDVFDAAMRSENSSTNCCARYVLPEQGKPVTMTSLMASVSHFHWKRNWEIEELTGMAGFGGGEGA